MQEALALKNSLLLAIDAARLALPDNAGRELYRDLSRLYAAVTDTLPPAGLRSLEIFSTAEEIPLLSLLWDSIGDASDASVDEAIEFNSLREVDALPPAEYQI